MDGVHFCLCIDSAILLECAQTVFACEGSTIVLERTLVLLDLLAVVLFD